MMVRTSFDRCNLGVHSYFGACQWWRSQTHTCLLLAFLKVPKLPYILQIPKIPRGILPGYPPLTRHAMRTRCGFVKFTSIKHPRSRLPFKTPPKKGKKEIGSLCSYAKLWVRDFTSCMELSSTRVEPDSGPQVCPVHASRGDPVRRNKPSFLCLLCIQYSRKCEAYYYF